MVRPSIRIPLLLILHQAITRRAWQFRSESAWPWERLGAGAGATVAGGVVTTTSPSITTTTTSAIPTGKTGRFRPGHLAAATTGSITRNIAVELHIQTARQPQNMAGRLVVIR